jgi:hypothetical protein
MDASGRICGWFFVFFVARAHDEEKSTGLLCATPDRKWHHEKRFSRRGTQNLQLGRADVAAPD